mmetsp:Transcript_118923/g.337176  ORF Transcript_118923/g.337176 Transcript_118923/m.337176 type:complete len:375 (-) Transcript_118923:1426-2550(-)
MLGSHGPRAMSFHSSMMWLAWASSCSSRKISADCSESCSSLRSLSLLAVRDSISSEMSPSCCAASRSSSELPASVDIMSMTEALLAFSSAALAVFSCMPRRSQSAWSSTACFCVSGTDSRVLRAISSCIRLALPTLAMESCSCSQPWPSSACTWALAAPSCSRSSFSFASARASCSRSRPLSFRRSSTSLRHSSCFPRSEAAAAATSSADFRAASRPSSDLASASCSDLCWPWALSCRARSSESSWLAACAAAAACSRSCSIARLCSSASLRWPSCAARSQASCPDSSSADARAASWPLSLLASASRSDFSWPSRSSCRARSADSFSLDLEASSVAAATCSRSCSTVCLCSSISRRRPCCSLRSDSRESSRPWV